MPPRLFPLKSKLGRVDYVLQLVQECERRYALEREFLLSASNSREFTMHRSSARGLTEGMFSFLFLIHYSSFLQGRVLWHLVPLEVNKRLNIKYARNTLKKEHL